MYFFRVQEAQKREIYTSLYPQMEVPTRDQKDD